MYVQYASSSGRNICSFSIAGWERARVSWPRCQLEVLVIGETELYTRNYQPSADERRGSLFRCMESRWEMGRQRWGGWCGEGLRTLNDYGCEMRGYPFYVFQARFL